MSTSRKRIGKYIVFLNQLLGKGAFSEVYNGIIEATYENVAIKIVEKKTIEKDEYTKNAFYSEIKIMKKLKSPNIIKFLDVHQTKNNFYIVLEKAQGTLRSIIKKRGALGEENAMTCLIQILNGFGELVKNGIIHRDLKPENILIKDTSLKIADFGFAKNLENGSSILKTLVGTPAYMAPQILKEERYTYKCDIWSIGVLTYELVVGKVPWQFGNNFTTIQMFKQEILTRKVVIPESLKVSDGMRDFIFGCMCIDENKRFDWQKIFTHPIFGQMYSKNFNKEGSTKITFIVSNFRMNLHSKNINLQKILSKSGNKLNKMNFEKLIKLISPDIAPQDLLVFYKYLQKGGEIDVSQFSKFLIKNECRLTGINLSDKKMDIEYEVQKVFDSQNSQNFECQNYKLNDRIKNSIQKNNVSLLNILNNLKEQNITIQIFKGVMGVVDVSLNQKQVCFLFKEFDIQGRDYITKRQLYQNLCKITQQLPSQSIS